MGHVDSLGFYLRKIMLFWYLIGIIGNIFIIAYYISKNRKNLKQMTLYSFLLTLLAFFDSYICIGWFIMACIPTNEIQLSETSARNMDAVLYFLSASSVTTVWLLVAVFFSRYYSIAYPFHQNFRKRIYFLFCFLVLLFWCCYLEMFFVFYVE